VQVDHISPCGCARTIDARDRSWSLWDCANIVLWMRPLPAGERPFFVMESGCFGMLRKKREWTSRLLDCYQRPTAGLCATDRYVHRYVIAGSLYPFTSIYLVTAGSATASLLAVLRVCNCKAAQLSIATPRTEGSCPRANRGGAALWIPLSTDRTLDRSGLLKPTQILRT
jgi:hypothetical protein